MIYNSILEHLPLAVFCKDIDDDFRYIFCNQKLLKLFGYAIEDVIGKTDDDLFGSDQVRRLRVEDELAVSEDDPNRTTEEKIINKNGDTIWVRSRRYIFIDRQDNSRKLVGVFEDISDLVLARESALAHRHRLDSISNNIPGFLYQFKLAPDGKMSFTYMNSYGESLFDADIAQLKDKPEMIFNMVLAEERAEFDRVLIQALSTASPWRWEGRLRTPKGNLRYIRGASEPTRLENGDILWDGILFDISKEAQADQKLAEQREHVNKAARLAALGAIAGGIAHEINTPLSVISISTELIRRLGSVEAGVGSEPRLQKALTSVENATEKIASIVSTMRSLCRPEKTHEKAWFNLKKLLSDVVLVSKYRLTGLGIQIDLTKISEQIEVLGNAQQVTQVFLNLVNNSCDALTPGGPNWIRIEVEKIQGEELKILFTDSGLGIPHEIVESIFSMSSVLSTKAPEDGGTGLGLGVSQGIMRGHRGAISYVASSPNTQFMICFPADIVSTELEIKSA